MFRREIKPKNTNCARVSTTPVDRNNLQARGPIRSTCSPSGVSWASRRARRFCWGGRVEGDPGRRLSVNTIRRIIRSRAATAGIEGRVSGHSLRVGGAQSLAAGGASLVEMQIAGRWQSPAMPGHYARGQLAASRKGLQVRICPRIASLLYGYYMVELENPGLAATPATVAVELKHFQPELPPAASLPF